MSFSGQVGIRLISLVHYRLEALVCPTEFLASVLGLRSGLAMDSVISLWPDKISCASSKTTRLGRTKPGHLAAYDLWFDVEIKISHSLFAHWVRDFTASVDSK